MIEQPFVGDNLEDNNDDTLYATSGYLSLADRTALKAQAYDIGIPVEQLAWIISGQVIELSHTAAQLQLAEADP